MPSSSGERKRKRTWFTMKVSIREPTWRRIKNFAPSAEAERRDCRAFSEGFGGCFGAMVVDVAGCCGLKRVG